MNSIPTDLTDTSVRPSLATLTRVEGCKMVDTRAGLWLLLLTALIGVGAMLGQSLGAADSQAQAVDVFFAATGGVSVLLPIVGILLVTSEWSQRTGLITFSLVPNRSRVVVAKLAAATVAALGVGLICLVLGLLGGSVFGSGGELEASQVGRGLLYLLLTVVIGVALGLVLQSSPVAIVLYFAAPILFAAIGAISVSLANVTEWLDQSGAITLVELDTGGVEWDKVAVTALVWAALPLAAGMVRLRRGDID